MFFFTEFYPLEIKNNIKKSICQYIKSELKYHIITFFDIFLLQITYSKDV